MPLQAQVGDHALFLRREAVEIQYEEEKFLVVPQSAILMLIRGDNYPPAE
jgi:co-chaperonin GroES (HSP10)